MVVAALLSCSRARRAATTRARPSPATASWSIASIHEPAAIGGTRLTRVAVRADAAGPAPRPHRSEDRSRLYVGSSEVKAPYALGTYERRRRRRRDRVVVQATLEYADVLPDHRRGARPDAARRARRAPHPGRGPALRRGDRDRQARQPSRPRARKVTQLRNDGTAGDPALLDTLERALMLLKKAKTEPEGRPLRKMIVLVIGDGRDRSGDRERVTRLGKRAARKASASTRSRSRRPTCAGRCSLLGELSKRSLGTFRWLAARQGRLVDRRSSSSSATRSTQQYVLTYFLDADDDPRARSSRSSPSGAPRRPSQRAQGGRARRAAASRARGYCVVESLRRCRSAASGRGVLGWLLLIGGIVVGAIVVLGVIGFVLTQRQQRIPLPPGYVPPGPCPARCRRARSRPARGRRAGPARRSSPRSSTRSRRSRRRWPRRRPAWCLT